MHTSVENYVPFCLRCGACGHTVSECVSPPAHPDVVHAAWQTPAHTSVQMEPQPDQNDNSVRMISLTDSDGPPQPVMVTCGKKQLYTALECPSSANSETMLSIHLLLSSARLDNPNLTLHQLKHELCTNKQLKIVTRPLTQFADRHWTSSRRSRKLKLSPQFR